MKFTFKDGTSFILEEGVQIEKFLANLAMAPNASEIKELFEKSGYNLDVVPGEFLKICTLNEKERQELKEVLESIESLGLKEVFNANLRVIVFKKTFLERVKWCLNNNIPFLNSDNSFVSMLNTAASFAEYTSKKPISEINNQESVVNPEIAPLITDPEDITVRNAIIKTLGEINMTNQNEDLSFIITSIIANLDSVIASDNKMYNTIGEKHLIMNAIKGVNLTPEMQELLNTKILVSFNDAELGVERGAVA